MKATTEKRLDNLEQRIAPAQTGNPYMIASADELLAIAHATARELTNKPAESLTADERYIMEWVAKHEN